MIYWAFFIEICVKKHTQIYYSYVKNATNFQKYIYFLNIENLESTHIFKICYEKYV